MASRKRPWSTRRRSDRISGLTDDVLGHVLSFLPTKEAARAAALARRWRHVFGSVHTISFEEEEGERAKDCVTYYHESEERKSYSNALLDGMSSALLCRRRCPGGLAVPVRSLRFAFDSWHWWDKVPVDQWLAYVLHRGGSGGHPELHLDLCFRIGPICGRNTDNRRDAGSDSDDENNRIRWRYLVPRRLFSCTAIRTLCLSYCRLRLSDVPIDLPFLETMRLTVLGDSGRSIQRLISSCPRLADLTLEALYTLTRVSVVGKRLRRFALRCCHNLKSVHIDASELRSLEYKGRVPTESLLSLHNPQTTVSSYTIDLCKGLSDETESASFTRFLQKISDTKHLHLHHGNLESKFFDAGGLPLFSSLTRLTLQGCIQSWDTVVIVRRILVQTPNLEVLTLLMQEPKEEESKDKDDDLVSHESSFSIPCLKHGLREIAVEGYAGSKAEEMLVKLLLRNTLVLERLHVVFKDGLGSKQKNRLQAQMGKWGPANSKKIFTCMK